MAHRAKAVQPTLASNRRNELLLPPLVEERIVPQRLAAIGPTRFQPAKQITPHRPNRNYTRI